MRQSLANYSSKAVNNLAKTYARRARAIAPFSKEEDVIVRRQDTVTVSVSRNLDKDARERAQKALQDTINASKSTFNDVWQSYLSLQAVVQQDGGLPIAQNIMQAVLRKCSPSLEALRTYSMQPASEDGLRHRVRHPLPYEDRLRAIIRHMRDAQQPPTIQDYNFILGQMAAVGHVTGAAAVLKEMEDVGGMQPSHSTFIYVLRTCVFLLESNQSSSARGALVQAATELANHVVKRLGEMNIEMDTRTMEFVLRIFKETGATAAFERLVRAMCAFDVTRPDRLPEEFEERLKAADSSGKPLPVPLPFTTSMFTTLITLYGRAGEVSKMVTAFEVLTNPYPLPSNLPPPNSDWWDEEEYDVANPVIQTPLQHRPEYVWEPPKSTPNAATYAAIIRYLAWAGHRTLCEHYMLLVVETDKREADSLRRDLTTIIERLQTNSAVSPESVSKSISTSSEEKEISASLGELSFLRSPQVFITPPMLYPVIGYANRYRLAEFIYWIRRRVRRLQARKEKDLLFFKEAYSLIPPAFQPSSVAVTRLSNMNIPYLEYHDKDGNRIEDKPLDLRLHIDLAEATVFVLKALLERMDEIVARLGQRANERLTRRVWNEKDIYLRDTSERNIITREMWNEMVKWKIWEGEVTGPRAPQAKLEGDEPSSPRLRPGRFVDQRLAARVRSRELLSEVV